MDHWSDSNKMMTMMMMM